MPLVDGILDCLPREEIVAAFQRSPGNEIGSGKFLSPESSAALAANTFGLFLKEPALLPPLPGVPKNRWSPTTVDIERCVRFPWSGGRHPWLDAFVETEDRIIGIESKRFEPFRTTKTGALSDAYWRPVWGDNMGPVETLRDAIADGSIAFKRLDAVQLVKHSFGLVTEARRLNKPATLLYLFAEPAKWPDGKLVDIVARDTHRSEISLYAKAVEGAAVSFAATSYRVLLDGWKDAVAETLVAHASEIDRVFAP